VAHAGDEAIARAMVQVFKGCIDQVLVFQEANAARWPCATTRLHNDTHLGRLTTGVHFLFMLPVEALRWSVRKRTNISLNGFQSSGYLSFFAQDTRARS